MQPGELLTSNYDVDRIIGAALREQQAAHITTDLDRLFTEAKQLATVDHPLVRTVVAQAATLVGVSIATQNYNNIKREALLEITQPYDEFNQSGIPVTSRILRYQSAIPTEQMRKFNGVCTIYLLGLFAQAPEVEVTTITEANLHYGLIRTESGQQTFFELARHQSATSGDNWLKAEMLDEQTQYALLDEFSKAAATARN